MHGLPVSIEYVCDVANNFITIETVSTIHQSNGCLNPDLKPDGEEETLLVVMNKMGGLFIDTERFLGKLFIDLSRKKVLSRMGLLIISHIHKFLMNFS